MIFVRNAAYTREPLNQSAAALSGSFAPTDRFENFEIHKVFLQFPNLNLETKSLADHSCDLIRGSLKRKTHTSNEVKKRCNDKTYQGREAMKMQERKTAPQSEME